jgi:hypothetical protein
MRTSILLLGGLLLMSIHAAAQATFNGYYISNDGDTTAVSFPNYRQWINNPAQIRALSNGGGEVVLTPESTREVTVAGYDTYRSRRFTRLTNPTSSMPNYSLLPATDSVEEIHGFLHLLTQAKGVSLYKYSDKKRMNFYIEKEGRLLELKHKIYLTDNGAVRDDNTFRQQLAVAFELDPTGRRATQSQLESLAYSEEQLEAFVEQLGGTKKSTKKPYPGSFRVMGGAALNLFTLSSKEFSSNNAQASYSPTISPVVGVALYEYSQRGFGHNFVTLQAWWYRFKNSGTHTTLSTTWEATYQSNIINVGIGLGRNFIQTADLTAYAAVVPHAMYLPDSKEEYRNYPRSVQVSIFTYNFSLQAGVRLPGGIGAWAHYNLLPIDTQDNLLYDQRHRSFQLGVDWRLKRKK